MLLQNIHFLLFYSTDTKACIYSKWNHEILHALRKVVFKLTCYKSMELIGHDLAVHLCSNWVTVSSFWLYYSHDVKLNQRCSFLNWYLYISRLCLRLCPIIVKWCLDHWFYCIYPHSRCLKVNLRCSMSYCINEKRFFFLQFVRLHFNTKLMWDRRTLLCICMTCLLIWNFSVPFNP